MIATVQRLAHNQALTLEEMRLLNEAISRLAEQGARARRSTLQEHVDIVDHVDDVHGKVIRALDDRLHRSTATEPVDKPEGDVTVQIGGRRFLFLSGTAWRLVGKILPWLISLGSGGYVAQHHLRDHAQPTLSAPREP